MTIGGWVGFAILAVIIAAIGIFVMVCAGKISRKILSGIVSAILIIALLRGMLWWFNNTASGQRSLTDQKSELANGLERTITVYTADGSVIAQYTGRIDIEGNDGGYVLFDFNGKRYTYYNCFVESVADIN